ncbi:Uncharacterised protein [Vibrio cholerae]|nr:Uncharacterised protein [Vibrio cholerae]
MASATEEDLAISVYYDCRHQNSTVHLQVCHQPSSNNQNAYAFVDKSVPSARLCLREIALGSPQTVARSAQYQRTLL